MFHIITIGDATLDTFLVIDNNSEDCKLNKEKRWLSLHYADKISIVHSTQSVGGNAANVAVGMKKLGFTTAIVTELGDDVNGHVIMDDLTRQKVDTSFAKILKDRDTRYSIVLNYQAERTILSYHAPRHYTLPTIPKTKWIYYSSLGANFEKLQDALVHYLKKNPEVKLAMNPGSYQIKNGVKKIRELLSRTDVLLVNKEEAEKIVGQKKKPKELLRALHTHGVQTIAITDSGKGSFGSDGEHMLSMPAYPIAPIAKTGAGDAFASGFLSALLHGKDVGEAMQWGTANASGVIQKFGAQNGLLTKTGIVKLIEKYKNVRPTLLK